MKKLISLLSVLVIIFAFAFSGCTFIDSGTPNDDSSINQNGENGSGNTSVIAPVEQATGVEFTTFSETERKELSVVDAVKKVERTSVAIKLSSGSGSGVIVGVKDKAETSVYILTCHHVISGGGNITVYLPDEDCNYENQDYIFTGVIDAKTYTDKAVTLVGGDRVSDIAVIKVDLNLPAKSGNKLSPSKVIRANVPVSSYKVQKGEEIFAIGNPSGSLPGSVSLGIVSYLERSVVVGGVGNMRLMQIGVSTNPGNSGGGLYNLYGELIGVTNAGNTNYDETNFAIPCELSSGNGFINIAKHLIKSQTSTNYGYVPSRWEIGISVQEVSVGYGVYYTQVSSVAIGSNAYNKLQVGDLITSLSWDFNGTKTYKIEADGKNFETTVESFDFYTSLMRTELVKGNKFYVGVTRERINKTIEIEIAKADYIFCNTGK